MSTTEILLPFAQIQNVLLDVGAPTHAGTKEPAEGVVMPPHDTYGTRQIDVAEAQDWSDLEFGVSFAIPEPSLLEILHDPKAIKTTTRALVSVGCSASKLRQGFGLEYVGEGRWSGKITLSRQDVRGTVQLIPELVRTVAAKHAGPRHAKFVGAVLATGPHVEVVVDRFARPYNGPVVYRWEEFEKSENGWIASRPDDVCFADLRDIPRIHLNLRWKSLQPILTNNAVVGYQAALQHAYAAGIAQGVWVQMLTTAVASIRHDAESDAFAPGSGWKGQLANHVASELYPDMGAGDAYRTLYHALRDPEQAATLVSQLGSLAHDHSDAGALLDKAARIAAPKMKDEGASQ